MSGELVVQQGGALSLGQIRDRVNLIQQVMRSVMKEKTHYDTIPGTDKPTLLKAGAEVLATTFQIAVDPEVHDLSTPEEVRYRVRVVGRSQASGITVGVGIGECSSNEEKYKWRRMVCQEEFDGTDETRRRVKYARGRNDSHYTIKQIRTEPADVANTILKMAKKRALVDFTLTALAASDIFAQDFEDMPEELREGGEPKKEEIKQPKAMEKKEVRPEGKPEPGPSTPGTINATQAKIIRKKLEHSGKDEDALCQHFKIESLEKLPMSSINEALAWSTAA